MTDFPEITHSSDNGPEDGGDVQDPEFLHHRVRVELPAEPPQLNRQAAEALLSLLMKARGGQATADRSE